MPRHSSAYRHTAILGATDSTLNWPGGGVLSFLTPSLGGTGPFSQEAEVPVGLSDLHMMPHSLKRLAGF